MRTRNARLSVLLCLGSLVGCWTARQAIAQGGQEEPRRQAVKLDPEIYNAYVGQYQFAPNVLFTLRREGPFLLAQLTGQPAIAVYPQSETKFFWKVVDAQFTIQKDKDGNVESIFFEQGGIKRTAKKISNALPEQVVFPLTEPAILSPRLLALSAAVKSGNRDADGKFWNDMKDKSPLVESANDDRQNLFVTFLWRGNDMTQRINLNGGLPSWERNKWLKHLPGTDIWYRTEKMPVDSRFTYSFIVNGPDKAPEPNDPAFAKYIENVTTRIDPLNPHAVILQGTLPASYVELAKAPAQPWLEPMPGVAKGTLKELKVKSDSLKGERAVTIYTPAGYDPKGDKYGLLVLMDGAYYQDSEMIPGPVILDNLIAKKKIPPLVVAFVKHGLTTRIPDLSCSKPFADFLCKELVPQVRSEYHVSAEPERTTIGGLSLGGLMASFCALHHSEIFGNVLSQSGSYWWYPGGIEEADEVLRNGEPGWLTREYAAAPRKAVRFYLEIGRFEEDGFGTGCSEHRRFRDVLKAKGYSVQYSEYSGGHDYVCWRGSFADGLIALTATNTKQ